MSLVCLYTHPVRQSRPIAWCESLPQYSQCYHIRIEHCQQNFRRKFYARWLIGTFIAEAWFSYQIKSCEICDRFVYNFLGVNRFPAVGITPPMLLYSYYIHLPPTQHNIINWQASSLHTHQEPWPMSVVYHKRVHNKTTHLKKRETSSAQAIHSLHQTNGAFKTMLLCPLL